MTSGAWGFGLGKPAGELGAASRGTTGKLPRLSRIIVALAYFYAALAGSAVFGAVVLAPWGLLLLLLVPPFMLAAFWLAVVAVGVSRMEEDDA